MTNVGAITCDYQTVQQNAALQLLLRLVATDAVRSPGSRLSDDLYRLYLVAFGWLLFPVYGEVLAWLLPTSDAVMQEAYPVIAVVVQLGWLWSGARGGPLAVSRASIVNELGAPVRRRTVLAPQLLRQGASWGAGGAVVGGVLVSLGGEFTFSEAVPVSAACFLLLFAAVMWACPFMIGMRVTNKARVFYIGGALSAAFVAAGTAIFVGNITDNFVLLTLLLIAVVGVVTSWHALDHIPVWSVWQRAGNIEAARSAMLEVDFHRMMIDIRSAGDDRAEGETRLPSRWLSMWRGIAPIRHALPWSAVRIAAGLIAATLLLVLAPIDEGIVLLAVGGVWLVLGYEITRGIAAIADHVSLLRHYPKSSFWLLVGQLTSSLVLGALLIALTYGWWFGVNQTEAGVAVIVGAMGIVGGAMQARLGSPDTSVYIDKFGMQAAAAMLWFRAASAPVAVFLAVVLTFHGFALQPLDLGADVDIAPLARTLIPVLFIVSVATSLRPLEKAAQ